MSDTSITVIYHAISPTVLFHLCQKYKSLPITTDVVSSNPTQGEVYSIIY